MLDSVKLIYAMIIPSVILLVLVMAIIFCIWCYFTLLERQKTRDPQQPRMYVTTVRNRTSISAGQRPSIYITPVNMPPPKYEAMAPPSYEEVVGLHYPQLAAASASQPPPPGAAASTAEPPQPPATASDRPAPADTTLHIGCSRLP